MTTQLQDKADTILKMAEVNRIHKDLYGMQGSSFESFMKDISPGATESKLKRTPGDKDHPFKFVETISLKTHNPHHSTCIEAKVNAISGLGQDSIPDETMKKLDTMCEDSWLELISDVTEDYSQVGNGFIEVIRGEKGEIIKLFHIPAPSCRVVVVGDHNEIIYKVTPEEGLERLLLKFGLTEDDYIADLNEEAVGITDIEGEFESEIIHFKKPSSTSMYYGVPNWLGAIPSIELAQCLHQYNYDFFLNRGVPEFLLLFLGTTIPEADWEELKKNLKSNVGLGNSHKSQIANLAGVNPENVQLHKLGIDSKGDEAFSKASDTLSLEIVSAHQVPPLLAGIQIPGKMGAANELPNALAAFQLLVIQQDQNVMVNKLDCTLGDDPSFPVNRGSFTFNSILDQIAEAQQKLNPMDTMSRMREPVTGANRDLNEGLKD